MAALLVILAVLAVLVILLLIPASVCVTLFDGEARAVIRYLFARWTLPPDEGRAGKKKKKPAPEKKQKAKKRKKKDAPPKEKPEWDSARVQAVIELCAGLLKACGRSGGIGLRGVKMRELKLQVMVVREDAFRTAARAGELNAVAYAAAGLLQNYVQIGFLYINIYPGFWSSKETAAFEARFTIRPMRILAAFAALLAGGFPPLLAFMRALPARPGKARAEETKSKQEV